jgi:hypothetical protein
VAPTAGQPAGPLTVHSAATRTADTIRIDGRLDEAGWQATTPLSRFVQREPIEGGEPSEETEIRVLFTETALYIGAVCHDRSPREIIATQLSRDADLDVDDRLTIVLDPFFDHRNGFFFQVNAAGARADGQVSNNAESLSRDWDGIWNAAARITDDGWIAEILNTDILTLKADYNVTANLSWANLVQYDNESTIAGLQSRFRWILQPGSDLFFIVNRGWRRRVDEGGFEPVFDRASAKLQYTVRF